MENTKMNYFRFDGIELNKGQRYEAILLEWRLAESLKGLNLELIFELIGMRGVPFYVSTPVDLDNPKFRDIICDFGMLDEEEGVDFSVLDGDYVFSVLLDEYNGNYFIDKFCWKGDEKYQDMIMDDSNQG